jgi:hypothetical protein
LVTLTDDVAYEVIVTSKKQWLIWGLLTAVTLFFLWALAVNALPALRGPDEWRWTYAVPGQPTRHLLGTAVVAAYVLIALWWGGKCVGGEFSRRKAVPLLLFCALSVPALQIGLLAGESPDVVEQLAFRTLSSGSSGFFSVGSIIDDPADFVAHYPARMSTFPVHPQRYPPGIPLLFYASRTPLAVGGVGEKLGAYIRPYQCADLTLMRIPNEVMGTAVLQMLLPLLSALVIFPLFGLARRTLGWSTAVWSVALYPLIPSFTLWAGRWDQFFPLLTVTAWYLLVVGLTERRRWVMLLAGMMLALATMLSFGLLVMLAPMGLWALLWLAGHRTAWTWREMLLLTLFFMAGLALIWGGYQVWAGPGLLGIWRVSMSFHLGLARSYWTWLGYHLYDFGIFIGLPMALLCLFAFFYALLTARRELVAFPIAFGLGLLLLDISGTARGEVARVWIFLTPFAVMCAVWGLGRLGSGRWATAVLMTLLALQLLTFNAFLRVVNTGLTSVPPREEMVTRPSLSHEADVHFGDNIHLLAYDLSPQNIIPGESVTVTLLWQADGRVDTPYTVFNHLVSPTGELVAQQDGMPQASTLPTTCWQPGELITDSYTIATLPEMTLGTYSLLMGLYTPETGVRLPVLGTLAEEGDLFSLGNVQVQRP